MQTCRSVRFFLSLLVGFVLVASCFAVPQDEEERERFGKRDNPAAREQWFRRGRQTRNGQSAARMLHNAYQSKMKLRGKRESRFRSLAATRALPDKALAASIGVWSNLGPRPIVDNLTVPNGYGALAGRVTAVVVDQNDLSGNTVYAAGAYGGVWKSTNAAASDPTLVQWTPITDDQPTLSVGAIALQPGNSNLILVGTGEPNYAGDSYYGVGILRSTDGGASWTTIANSTDGHSLYGSGIGQFAFSTKNTQTVLAAASWATLGPFYQAPNSSGAPGLYLSTDAGVSWRVVPLTNDGTSFFTTDVSSVVYNPKQDKFYVVVPFEGVYVSQGTSSAGFSSFIRLKNQPGKSGVLSTTNCPATGSSKCPLLRGSLTVRPVLSTNDPDQMFMWFVADGNGDSTDDQGIWKSSTDSSGTVTWTSISDTGITNCSDTYGCGTKQSFYNLYLSAVPNGTNTDLYAGTINIYKCSITSANPSCATTPFQNLTHSYGCSNISKVHPDQHGFDFLASNPAIVFFGNDGGVYRSLSAETNLKTGTCPATNTKANAFDNLNTHIGPLTQFVWGTNHPTDPATLMGGSQDNGTMATSPSSPAGGDAGWWQVNAGDGGYNWIDPLTPTNWYSAYTGVTVQYCTNTINCNTNTFAPLIIDDDSAGVHQTDGDNSAFYTPYILDPAKPTQIIVGTCRVWRGPNDTTKWPNNSTVNAISHQLGSSSDAACPSNSDVIQAIAAGGPSGANGSKVIYAGTSGGHVYVTTNADTGVASWSDITSGINPNQFPISSVAIDWNDPTGMTAYATIQGFTSTGQGHVWLTHDGGVNWLDETNGLPNAPVNDIALDPVTAGTVYVATDTGVFTASTNGGAQWTEIGPTSGLGYLPNVSVFHLAIYKNGTDERLRVWTHGRGVWETALTPPDVSLSPTTINVQANIGSTLGATTTLTNNSLQVLTLGTPVFGYDIKHEFSFDTTNTTCGTSLNSGASCVLAFQFAPTATGTDNASVSLTTSSASLPTVNVYLNGTGLQPGTDFAFSMGSNPTSQTVTAGQSASYFFNIQALPAGSNGLAAPVSFSCSGLPDKSACTFSPTSVTVPNGGSTLTITTTAPTTASATTQNVGLGAVAFVLFLPGLVFVSSRKLRTRWAWLSLCILGGSLFWVTACGGGSSASTPPPAPTPTPVPGTPAGTYKVTITGTDGTHTHTQDVTLIVQ